MSPFPALAGDALWRLERVSLQPARLREVSAEIPRGVTAVIGWSGAGKTSLLNLLVRFEKPDAGRLIGEPRVAWVPQAGGLWPHCTAREHLRIARPSSAGIEDLLAAFDLAEKALAHPHELSQGEQARLAVARALVADVEVLVMDEPLAHVDPARLGEYWRVIRETVAATGASLLFSTHVPEIALGEAAHAICLHAGRVIHAGPMTELYAHPPTSELMNFLGPGNWLSPEEARIWLGETLRAPCCFRPEQIAIEPAHVSSIVVRSAAFRGSLEEVELRHVNSAAVRKFFHRPSSAHLVAGAPVTLRFRE